MRGWARGGLRTRVVASFTLGAMALAGLAALLIYGLARGYLVDQRERSAVRQAFADASYVRDGLRTSGFPVSDVLGGVAPPAGAAILVRRDGRWYSTSLEVGDEDLPAGLVGVVEGGEAGTAWASQGRRPVLVVGVPLPAVDAEYYAVTVTSELQSTLDALRTALVAFALLIAAGAGLLSAWAARRAMAPLNAVAGTAARIAGGELGTRLAPTSDPDLATIVGSFNSMVDALEEQIQREARFTADVSHELRSPLTALVTSVDLLQRRRDDLPERSRQVLDLVRRELDRFARTLEDLLELGRLEAGASAGERVDVALGDLVRQALDRCGRPVSLLAAAPGGAAEVVVHVDKQQLSRALVNLVDNAERHGRGLVSVSLRREGAHALVQVDDAGPGVAEEDRQRVFERFARSGSRGSLPGAGLGLSLVAESVHAHGGAVWCEDSPQGGARFVVRLPARARIPRGVPA
ncbi:signal transduction histidine kinase [Kineococcus xinjiangensis]|uniref:histidine kinase n=1 Tax=Kineococcus xinjiangensis TaxID=512762 RepID=A0A2S6IFE3_9ACTN|nr:ATP-binding protein [Kineococcus xinjiangensis]PPK92870.1 signal transduction histidine kinase [Kineococcus xinjiangensis]